MFTTRIRARLAELTARFVATCALCGTPVPDGQVMCADCATR